MSTDNPGAPGPGVQSMTGFGSATFEVGGQGYRVDVKTVNHKGLNVRLRAPSEFAPVETAAQKIIGRAVGRGAVDVSIHRESDTPAPVEVVVDGDGIGRVMESLQSVARHVGAPAPTIEAALRLGDFVEVRRARVPDEELRAGLEAGLAAALEQLVAMRRREGEELVADLLARLDRLDGILDALAEVAPTVMTGYEERLRKRLAEAEERLGVELDAGRVGAELVVYADRSDVTEELVRARAHVTHFREILGRGEALSGKRLDFLAQELFREFNTVGSKCREAGMASSVVDGKVELEKIREQIQNLA